MKLEFFPGKNGHMLCPTSEGLIVINKDIKLEDGIKLLESGEARVVESTFNGKPSTSILVGFASTNSTQVEVKAIKAKRSAAVAVSIEYVD